MGEGRSAEPAAGNEWSTEQVRKQVAAYRVQIQRRRGAAKHHSTTCFSSRPTQRARRWGSSSWSQRQTSADTAVSSPSRRLHSRASYSAAAAPMARTAAAAVRRGEGRSQGSQMHGVELGGGSTRIWAHRDEIARAYPQTRDIPAPRYRRRRGGQMCA